MGKNQHVTPKGDKWQVKGANNSKATVIVSTQKEGIEIARKIANNQDGEVVIHRKNGKIRDKRTPRIKK